MARRRRSAHAGLVSCLPGFRGSSRLARFVPKLGAHEARPDSVEGARPGAATCSLDQRSSQKPHKQRRGRTTVANETEDLVWLWEAWHRF
ncbi:hypothetical protein BD310DRAFT_918678 [Dichomitus squalens]|uniref:Uncharacterized protein n=1 Tax=Dichomitus squalens TaxID=114155 RepID=A0A4Q9Q5J1_9APHY|nr:hypothetical protein BD310DRAFT_918678 [Dichomitus squalens]